jgi:hypothetical protein
MVHCEGHGRKGVLVYLNVPPYRFHSGIGKPEIPLSEVEAFREQNRARDIQKKSKSSKHPSAKFDVIYSNEILLPGIFHLPCKWAFRCALVIMYNSFGS